MPVATCPLGCYLNPRPMNTLASLFNLAGPDLIVILGIVLLLFGAKKLPELARGMGQAVKEFSKAKDEFEREVTRPVPEPPRIQEPLTEAPKVAVSQDHPEHPDPTAHVPPFQPHV